MPTVGTAPCCPLSRAKERGPSNSQVSYKYSVIVRDCESETWNFGLDESSTYPASCQRLRTSRNSPGLCTVGPGGALATTTNFRFLRSCRLHYVLTNLLPTRVLSMYVSDLNYSPIILADTAAMISGSHLYQVCTQIRRSY